jgi:hypothetical protein
MSANLQKNIVGTDTVTVSSEPGILVSLIINTAVVGGVVTIYDAATAVGDPVATVTLPALTLLESIGQLNYNCIMSQGITVAVVGAVDVTVIYR